jgi:maleate isomerase
VEEATLRAHVAEMDGDDIDAFVQVGTNLSMCELCSELEVEYGKPFVAINAATYWHSLRAMGIYDQFSGHGPLFEKH